MTTKQIKNRVPECLGVGMVEHKARKAIDEKNLPAAGGITCEVVFIDANTVFNSVHND